MASAAFEQELFTAFNMAFRAGGSALTATQLDTLRSAISRLADTVEKGGKDQAVDLVRQLQTQISNGFDKVAKDIQKEILLNKDVQGKVEGMEVYFKNKEANDLIEYQKLQDQINELNNTVKHLTNKVTNETMRIGSNRRENSRNVQKDK